MSEIIIRIPTSHFEERTYAVECVFTHILGIPYVLEKTENHFSVINYESKQIRLNDSFWTFDDKECYGMSRMPKVHYGFNDFCPEKDIPILYGTNNIKYNGDSIDCDIDIFASVFFLLSRWEEYVVESKDEHQRFSVKESVAYKYGFHKRPVVNEYAVMLFNMLIKLGVPVVKKNLFSIQLTHDIDLLVFPNKIKSIIRDFAWVVLKRRQLAFAIKSFFNSILKDPYDLYDFFMDVSETIGVKSRFYFMSATSLIDSYDSANYLNYPKFQKVINNIIRRGHIVGFHPSYFTSQNFDCWHTEYKVLQEKVPVKIKEGRQHYLRVVLPDTLHIWEKHFDIDSSLGFADSDGFRCGTGNTFPLYDFQKNCKTGVMEMPLVLMDTTLTMYLNLSVHDSENIIKEYIDIAHKYSMPMTFLFHNNFYGFKRKGWKQLYKNITHYYLLKKNEIK